METNLHMKSSLYLVSMHTPLRKMANSLSKILIIRRRIRPRTNIPRRIQHSLRLRSLCLLSALLRSLLLLHLLVAQRGQATRNLLDLLARQVLCNLLGELLQEERVLPLLRVGRYERHERLAQLGELVLCVWVEDVEGAEVDGLAGVARVGDGDGFGDALVAESEVAEQLFGLGARAVDFLLS
jgi:hypothetical protein